jgi:hypothetical protein
VRIALACLALAGCTDAALAPGEIGIARAFGEVRGAPPLDLVPPILDRQGHVYVLYGPRDTPALQVFVGGPDGGWRGGCELTEGSGGVHGWIGHADDRAWYWAGDALVEVDGATGACRQVLDRDPQTHAELSFRAVVPRVDESPSRLTLTAIVSGPDSESLYAVVVDLDTHAYEVLVPLEVPRTDVLGTGSAADEGVVVLGGGHTLWISRDGEVRAGARLGSWTEARAVAPLAVGDDGTVAGVLSDGRTVAFGAWGDVAGRIEGMETIGVHRVKGGLYAVGTAAGKPVAARLTQGTTEAPRAFAVSEKLGATLRGRLDVLDDRQATRSWLDWTEPRPALGDWPLVSAFPPHVDDGGHGGWLVAGPAYRVSGEPFTLVAYVPIGVGYP